MSKKQWSDLTKGQQQAVVAGAVLELALTTVALRDLAHRARREVRGPKLLWVAAMVVQPFGPLAYLWFGRRSR
jgi:Phospholipase_D-nuclease N-terminal